MLKILLVAPYAHLADLARQLGRVQPHRDVVLDVVEAIGVKCVDELDLDADVVISRGATASALRQRLSPHVPVVELYVTGYDVIRSVQPSSPGGGDYSFLLEQRGDVDTPPSNPFE